MSDCDHPEAYQKGGNPCPVCADMEELERLRVLVAEIRGALPTAEDAGAFMRWLAERLEVPM